MKSRLLGMFMLLATLMPAQTFTTLYQFQGGLDGQLPSGTLIADGQGNLYGATMQGGGGTNCGAEQCGTIFEVTVSSGVKTTLYSFPDISVGMYPNAPLVMDAKGNLYGTTHYGGAGGCGTVFELSGGVVAILHAFAGAGKDGCAPLWGLAMDSAGDLYGTTTGGYGTVFELSPSAGGWTFATLSRFNTLAFNPDGPLAIDAQGNLYGTTLDGEGKKGLNGQGTAYKLYQKNGGWFRQQLHNFSGTLQEPWGGVTFDSQGNLYGVTALKYQTHTGGIFELTPLASGYWECSWPEKFFGPVPDGGITVAGSSLYGVTTGEVYRLDKGVEGWSMASLYQFPKGEPPLGNVVVDAQGNVYGVAEGDGETSFGLVYQIQP